MKGKIIKGIAGFYYVHVADDGHAVDVGHAPGTVYECKAKESFARITENPWSGMTWRWMSWMRHRKRKYQGIASQTQ